MDMGIGYVYEIQSSLTDWFDWTVFNVTSSHLHFLKPKQAGKTCKAILNISAFTSVSLR